MRANSDRLGWRALFAASIVSLLVAFGIAGAEKASAAEWNMLLGYGKDNYHTQIAQQFAANVNRRTNGEMLIRTYPNNSLVPAHEIFDAVSRNTYPLGERLMTALGGESAIFEIDTIPFLVQNFDHARKLHEAALPEIHNALRARGLIYLYTVPWPPQGLYSIRPINTIDDLRGLRFYAYDDVTARLSELVGALPSSASQLGGSIFDGQQIEVLFSSSVTGAEYAYWNSVDYWYNYRAWIPKNIVFVNAQAWMSIDPGLQRIILEEAEKAEKQGWAKAMVVDVTARNTLAENGMRVIDPSGPVRDELEVVGRIIADEWLLRVGVGGAAALASYQRLR